MLAAAFVAWLVALFGDHAVKGLGRVFLGSSRDRELVAALSKATDTAIEAALTDIPDSVRAALESALHERFMLPPVNMLDGRTPVRTALAEAVREQIEPLADPTATVSGESFLDELGIDARRLSVDLTQIAIVSIQQVAQRFSALAQLAAQLNADAVIEQGADIQVRVDRILDLLEKLMQDVLSPDPFLERQQVSRSARQLLPSAVNRLVDALLDIRSIADPAMRAVLRENLPEPLRSSFHEVPVLRVQIYDFVQTSLRYTNGMQSLVQVIRSFERDSLPMRQLDAVILEIGGQLSAPGSPGIEAGLGD